MHCCRGCSADFFRIGPACPVCALPSLGGSRCGPCATRPPAFDRTIAALRYADPIDRLVQALKYNRQLPLARALAGLLGDALSPGSTQLLVPVPLGPQRLRARGFNQSFEIARHLGLRLGLPVMPRAAVRVRETVQQADLALDERARNMRGAFAVSSAVLGRRIAIVDDVMTTGTTLAELAQAAKRAGAIEVEAWVVARAYKD